MLKVSPACCVWAMWCMWWCPNEFNHFTSFPQAQPLSRVAQCHRSAITDQGRTGDNNPEITMLVVCVCVAEHGLFVLTSPRMCWAADTKSCYSYSVLAALLYESFHLLPHCVRTKIVLEFLELTIIGFSKVIIIFPLMFILWAIKEFFLKTLTNWRCTL